MKKTIWLLSLPILAFAVQVAVYGPKLPAEVASHFDSAGRANGWSSREDFLLLFAAVFFGVGVLFLGIISALPIIPNALINLPRKDYWLAPERRLESLAKLRDQLVWFILATQTFLLAVFQLTLEANLRRPVALRNEPLIAFLVAYLVFTTFWVIRLYRTFRVPRGSAGDSGTPGLR